MKNSQKLMLKKFDRIIASFREVERRLGKKPKCFVVTKSEKMDLERIIKVSGKDLKELCGVPLVVVQDLE